jgi:hypothetical protein
MRKLSERRIEYMKAVLPYGMWTCADGRQVLFNRRYKPIWQRYPGHPATVAEVEEWVPWIRQEWFYHDGNSPWRYAVGLRSCGKVLAAWDLQVQAEWLSQLISVLSSIPLREDTVPHTRMKAAKEAAAAINGST